MPLNGTLIGKARKAIQDAFDIGEISTLLREQLNLELGNIVSSRGTESEQISGLLQAASDAGWDEQFLQVLIDARPNREDFRASMRAILAARPATLTLIGGESEGTSGWRRIVSSYYRQVVVAGLLVVLGAAGFAWSYGVPSWLFSGEEACVKSIQEFWERGFNAAAANIDELDDYIKRANVRLKASESCSDNPTAAEVAQNIRDKIALAEKWLDSRNVEYEVQRFVEKFGSLTDTGLKDIETEKLSEAELRGSQLMEHLSTAHPEIRRKWETILETVVATLSKEVKLRNENTLPDESPQVVLNFVEIKRKYKEIEIGQVKRIPVVFHLLYKGAENRTEIPDDRIHAQLDSLNADFNGANSELGSVPAGFRPRIGIARIEFYFSNVDPSGKSTTGITRTETTVSEFPVDEIKHKSSGGVDAWNSAKYLNVWVGQLADGLVSYAQFPGENAETDGVVITPSVLAGARPPFDKGRNLTHEIGHWLGLRHIWGDEDACTDDDEIADTPVQAQANFGKTAFPKISCNNGPIGDMFMNFMDYGDDEVAVMFTEGQVVRMHETLEGARKALIQPETN